MYSIYALSDPKTFGIRYVGLSRNAHKRYATHILNTTKQKSPKDLWIQDLLQSNMAPVLSVLETVETKREAEIRESYWIQYHLNQGIALLNTHKNTYTLHSDPMMEEDLRHFLRERGWNLSRRKRGKREYFYAQKWRHGDAYLCPVSKVEGITEDKVLEKLAKAL